MVLLDFAENYSFVVQDEAQSFPWNNMQCSIHPAVIYYIYDGQLTSKRMCIVSEDLEHDVSFVFEVQKAVVKWIKQNVSSVNKITYFSDGCTQQYKNYENFMNLCCHFEDFAINATWVFFATSHGKLPCDGVGGTVKRIVKRASLLRSSSDAILSVTAFYEYCCKNISGIEFCHISTSALEYTRENLKKRFEGGSTIPGTRSYHIFEPLQAGIIGYKYVASDANYAGQTNFFNYPSFVLVKPMDFVACAYNGCRWIGIALSTNDDLKDAQVKFMKPAGPSSCFSWPIYDDICDIPFTDIICKVQCPSTHGSGRSYQMTVCVKLQKNSGNGSY